MLAEAIVLIPKSANKGTEIQMDVLPLVLCKDCIHYRYYGLSAETVSECTIDHCENPDADWFCADGESGSCNE